MAKSKEQKRLEASERQKEYDNLSTEQKLTRLEDRGHDGCGEYTKLLLKREKEIKVDVR